MDANKETGMRYAGIVIQSPAFGRFGSLPREIRDEIYEYCLVASGTALRFYKPSKKTKVLHLPRLTKASRSLRDECPCEDLPPQLS
jgi:hypothetical protein